MFSKIILAGVMAAAFTAPSLAAPGDWNVLKTHTAQSLKHSCIVVQRTATMGEKHIGSFASKVEAQNVAANALNCRNRNYNDD